MTEALKPEQPAAPVDMFRLDLTSGEACMLHSMFSAGMRSTKSDPGAVAQTIRAHVHLVIAHKDEYAGLVKKLDAMGDWHNSLQTDVEGGVSVFTARPEIAGSGE